MAGKSIFSVPGYTWFEKPTSKESCNMKRGDSAWYRDYKISTRSELQRLCCKKVFLRRYCSFNVLVLCHIELQYSTEKSQKLTMLLHSQSY